MIRTLTTLNNWWFPKVPAERLGLLRITTGAYTLWYLGSRVDLLSQVARTDHHLYDPVSLIQWISTPLSPSFFDTIVWLTLALNICFLLGIAHRITGPLFAAAVYFTLCYRNSWSMVYHSHNVLVFHTLILGVTQAADALSIDTLWRRRKKQDLKHHEPAAEYGWPIQLMCAVTGITYCLAGIAKLATPAGIMWAKGEALRDQVGVDTLRKEVLGSEPGMLAPFFFDHIWIFTVMGIATLIVEAGAPLVMANRRLSQLWSIAVIGMHWGIFFIMGIRFRYQLSGLMFLSFFPLEKVLGKKWERRLSPTSNEQQQAPISTE